MSTCGANGCEKTEHLKACARCNAISYCSKKHQKNDWHRHRSTECTSAENRTWQALKGLGAWVDEKKERREIGIRYMREHHCFGKTGVLYLSFQSALKVEELIEGNISIDDPSITLEFVQEETVDPKLCSMQDGRLRYDPAVNFVYVLRVMCKGEWLYVNGITKIPDAREDDMTLILRAATFAADAHRSHKRKCDGSSYICHPLEVAWFLRDRAGITDVDVLLAAILHDTVEDCKEVTEEVIQEQFGARVASIVAEVTDDRSLTRVDRKRAQVQHVMNMSSEARLVKAADILHNVRSLRDNPPEGWSELRINGYVAWKKLIFNCGLRLINPEIESTLKELFNEMLTEEINHDLLAYVERYYAHLEEEELVSVM